jgi:hypothetical protein
MTLISILVLIKRAWQTALIEVTRINNEISITGSTHWTIFATNTVLNRARDTVMVD